MPGPSPALIPDAFTAVWAFSDPHGVRSGLLAALIEAGIATPEGHWKAPAGTALVGCGDYLDRGRDSLGVITLLRTLAAEAPRSGGLVVLNRGNHEQMVLDALAGSAQWVSGWLANGGEATLRSFGLELRGSALVPLVLEASLQAKAPWLRPWLEALPECARWRDTLFVHAGPAMSRTMEDYGRPLPGDRPNERLEHLWVRGEFYAGAGIAGNPAYGHLRDEGIARVVFGHTPMDAPTLFHANRSLCLDTNACASGAFPASLTLARIPLKGSLAAAPVVRVDTSAAPDRIAA